MKKYLIFRTDRVGDFIVSCILIKSIKRHYPNSKITVICSKKNYNFVKTINLVDKAILYPNSFFKKLAFYFFLSKNKFDCVLSLDGKKRSIFASSITKSKIKIFSVTKKYYKYFYFLSRKNFLYMSDYKTRIDEFKEILKKIGCNFSEKDLNIFDKENIRTNNNILKKIKAYSFNILHLDEKWTTGLYRGSKGIRNFYSIEPKKEELSIFIKELISKSKKKLLITSGEKNNFLLRHLIEEYQPITKLNNKFTKKKVIILDNLSFSDLIYIIKKTNILITCHGSPSHIASSFNVKTIDIYDKNLHDFYFFWTSHLRRYNYVYRDDFKKLKRKIFKFI